jgi:hypothetical protein
MASVHADRAARAARFAATAAPAFGPEQTVTVADLRPGDYVVTLPAYQNLPGVRVGSSVRAIEAADGWEQRHGRGARWGLPVAGRKVAFNTTGGAVLNTPSARPVVIRRPVEEN